MAKSFKEESPRVELSIFAPKTASDAAWTAYHIYRRIRANEEYPDEPVVSDAVRQRDMKTDWPLYQSECWLAKIDDDLAGSAFLWSRRAGTEDYEAYARFVSIDIGVRKAMRRRGVATALLRHIAARMRDAGQDLATFGCQTDDGHAFAHTIGAEVKYRATENRLDLTKVDASSIAGWERFSDDAGCTVEVHTGRVPLDRYEAIIPQLSVMLNTDPTGTLELPPRRFEMPAIRAWYAEMDKSGGDHMLVLLLHGDKVVAMSEANWHPEFPERAFQNLTAVSPELRGRGLAKSVKARMLRALLTRHPQLRLVITNNADGNEPMLAVNRQLGFVRHLDRRTYQLSRGAIEAALGET